MVYGNPCPTEGGLIRFGAEESDRLYVIQNGSLLVVNELAEEYDLFNSYCLDVDRVNRTLNGYVCPSEFRIGRDIFKGQMMALALCLVFAIPLLLATAFFYVAIPEFNDIHGKALTLNCINFAVALLLESIFQHQSRGNGSTDGKFIRNTENFVVFIGFYYCCRYNRNGKLCRILYSGNILLAIGELHEQLCSCLVSIFIKAPSSQHVFLLLENHEKDMLDR